MKCDLPDIVWWKCMLSVEENVTSCYVRFRWDFGYVRVRMLSVMCEGVLEEKVFLDLLPNDCN